MIRATSRLQKIVPLDYGTMLEYRSVWLLEIRPTADLFEIANLIDRF